MTKSILFILTIHNAISKYEIDQYIKRHILVNFARSVNKLPHLYNNKKTTIIQLLLKFMNWTNLHVYSYFIFNIFI